jgi:hypothetical protein
MTPHAQRQHHAATLAMISENARKCPIGQNRLNEPRH